jgi:hypothetical protein
MKFFQAKNRRYDAISFKSLLDFQCSSSGQKELKIFSFTMDPTQYVYFNS